MFPSVRLTSAPVLAFAERAAAELGDEDEVAEDVLDQGIALVSDAELRHLVERWILDYPAQWQSLVHTAADEQAVLRAVARGALEVALMERAPTPASSSRRSRCPGCRQAPRSPSSFRRRVSGRTTRRASQRPPVTRPSTRWRRR